MGVLRQNLSGKIGSLVLAAVVWWLIKQEITRSPSVLEELTLPPQATREL